MYIQRHSNIFFKARLKARRICKKLLLIFTKNGYLFSEKELYTNGGQAYFNFGIIHF